MNPTELPSETATETREFVYLRLEQPFDRFVDAIFRTPPEPYSWLLLPLLILTGLAVLSTIVVIGRAVARARAEAPAPIRRRDPIASIVWWTTFLSWFLLIVTALAVYFANDTYRPETVAPELKGDDLTRNKWRWRIVYAAAMLIGSAYTIVQYARETRTIRWYWAGLLSVLRIGVYTGLLFVFLLPTYRYKTKITRIGTGGRVMILFDVSPSMTKSGTEATASTAGGSRLGTILEFLTDGQVAFVRELVKNNPLAVYRFGDTLDPEGQVFAEKPGQAAAVEPAWARAEWEQFAKYDFKPLLLRGVSAEGHKAVAANTSWNGKDPGTPEWAASWTATWQAEFVTRDAADPQKMNRVVPPWLSPADAAALHENVTRVKDRVEFARAVLAGTKVPESLASALDREAGNRLQGVIVFSDGRSHGSTLAAEKVLDRTRMDKIPVFTIAVGQEQHSASIEIAGLRPADVVAADSVIEVPVEVDGRGLANQTVEVKLDVFMDGKDPKKDKPDFTIDDRRKKAEKAKGGLPVPYTVTFPPREPPTGEVTFRIDPTEVDERFTVEAKGTAFGRRQFREGTWAVRARVARHEKEPASTEAEHVMVRTGISVIDRPLRILLMASAPTHEYQKLRDVLVREVAEKRAVLCIRLQNEGGTDGNIVQDVPPEQLLSRFPSRFEVTPRKTDPEPKKADGKGPDPKAAAEKFDNLNEYDLIIAIDPDWSELTEETARHLEQWVKEQGGGLIFVAGVHKTPMLARIELGQPGKTEPKRDPDEPEQPGQGRNRHLISVLNILPVIPDDVVVLRGQPTPRTYRRLYLHPQPGSDLLRLDVRDATKNNPVAGWEEFFTGEERFVSDPRNPTAELTPRRGFLSSYPVMTQSSPNPTLAKAFRVQDNGLKPAAKLLAEFVYPNPLTKEKVTTPWLAVLDPVEKKGRSAYIGSGDLRFLQGYNREYYKQFWLKLCKYVAGTRDAKPNRGRVHLRKEYIANRPIPVLVRILNPKSTPYPRNAGIDPKFRIVQVAPDGTTKPVGEVYPLTPRDERDGSFDGYYTGELPPDPNLQAGEYRYRIVVDLPESGEAGETIEGEFRFRTQNPELDETTPDEAALRDLATTMDDDLKARLSDDKETWDKLEAGLKDQQVPVIKDGVEVGRATKLAFRINQRDLLPLIPKCLPKPPIPVTEIPGGVRYEDLWDKGFEPNPEYTGWIAPGQQRIAYVLLALVGLLAFEWIGRKMLRLA